MIKAKAKENLKLADGGDRKSENAKNQGYPKSDKVENPINTNEELAKLAGVGHNTIHQFRIIKKEGTPGQRRISILHYTCLNDQNLKSIITLTLTTILVCRVFATYFFNHVAFSLHDHIPGSGI